MIIVSILVTAMVIGSFAFAIIHIITTSSHEMIEELLIDKENLELDKTNLESRVNALCKMIEVQDKLLSELTEPSLQIEVNDPITVKFESNE